MVTIKLIVMSLTILEERQSDQEGQQSEAQREAEIVYNIFRFGTVIMSLIVFCQVVTGIVFCWRARRVKQITLLPKIIMGLASIEGIILSSYYIAKVFFMKSCSATVIFLMNIVASISTPTIMGLLIRFERVQVQLRAREENTIKILAAIKRANVLEVVFILTLVVSFILNALGGYGNQTFRIPVKIAQVLDISGLIFEIGFVCIFSFSIVSVNE